MPPNNTLLGMTTAEPVSTDVHSNINDLIAQSDKTHLWQKALGEVEKSMSGYKHPEPIAGTAPDVALSPLVAAKSIPNLLKLIKKINLKNPLYHYTSARNAEQILKSGKIKTSNVFPGYTEDQYWNQLSNKNLPKSFSVTRDPMFTSRPHAHIGTDVKLILDRDDLIRKGHRIKPFAEEGFKKTKKSLFYKGEDKIRNPYFEFEERILGDLPVSDIKLIDFMKFPNIFDDVGYNFPGVGLNRANLLHKVLKKDIPIMMSRGARKDVQQLKRLYPEALTNIDYDKIMSAPTYKYNPFK